MGLVASIVADAACIVAFAAVGRRNHDEADGVGAVLTTAAPFLCALAVAWAIVVALRRSKAQPPEPVRLGAGVVIWVVTVGAGLILRRAIWDRGTALSFVIVATVFLGVLILGWRAAYSRTHRARTHASDH